MDGAANSGPPLPLKGLKVLSIEQYGAGPFCTQYLASFGADVIKIENPALGGDVARITGPHRLGDQDSLYFQAFNQGKRSLALDLKSPEGQAVFRRLAAAVDVVANNARGDQPAKLGLTYDQLKSVNPALVCAHLSAYGRDNERAAFPGYDYLMQAEAGFMELTGDPDGMPQRTGLSLVDFMTGMNQLFAIMAGVYRARETGAGGDYDVTLFDAALFQLSYPALWHLNENYQMTRQPRSAHPDATPSQVVKTRDGWIFLMCQIDKFWKTFCELVPIPGLTDNPQYATTAARRRDRETITRLLDTAFAEKTTDEWIEILQGHIPVAPILTMEDALRNPFVHEVGMIQEVDHPKRPDMKVLANPIRIDGKRVPAQPGPNTVGADSRAILEEFGFDADEIADFKRQGVI